MKIKEV